jgi:hypothetical protein
MLKYADEHGQMEVTRQEEDRSNKNKKKLRSLT